MVAVQEIKPQEKVIARITLNYVHRDWEVFLLKMPVTAVATRCDDGGVTYECADLGTIGHGWTIWTAFVAMQDDFPVVYDEIVKEDDSNLSLDAREVKARILSHTGRMLW